MTITDRIRENLKLASDTAAPYVDSAQKHASVAFASVQEKIHGGGGGGMHHSASSKDVTVRLRPATLRMDLRSSCLTLPCTDAQILSGTKVADDVHRRNRARTRAGSPAC
jgi:hypothetical protein